MGDWVKLRKGEYVNLNNVIRTIRGPAGKGVVLYLVSREQVILTDTDAATVIMHLEQRTKEP